LLLRAKKIFIVKLEYNVNCFRFTACKPLKNAKSAPDLAVSGALFVVFDGAFFYISFQQFLLKTLLVLLKTRGNHVFSTFYPVENSENPCQYLF